MEKYKVKFVNSFWAAFDTEAYENTQVFFLKRDAVEAVKKMNNQRSK